MDDTVKTTKVTKPIDGNTSLRFVNHFANDVLSQVVVYCLDPLNRLELLIHCSIAKVSII